MATNDAAGDDQRLSRLVALVSKKEATLIAGKAQAAGLSVSAFLRERALEEEKADHFDALLDLMEANLDSATDTINAALKRMETNG